MKIKKQTKRAATRLFRLCLVDGILNEKRTIEVVREVVAAHRRDGLALLSHFRRLVKLNSALHTAEVESVEPLPEDLRAKIEANLARTRGSGMTVSYSINPKLIGGMRIRVANDVYDSSILARLAELEKTFER